MCSLIPFESCLLAQGSSWTSWAASIPCRLGVHLEVQGSYDLYAILFIFGLLYITTSTVGDNSPIAPELEGLGSVD